MWRRTRRRKEGSSSASFRSSARRQSSLAKTTVLTAAIFFLLLNLFCLVTTTVVLVDATSYTCPGGANVLAISGVDETASGIVVGGTTSGCKLTIRDSTARFISISGTISSSATEITIDNVLFTDVESSRKGCIVFLGAVSGASFIRITNVRLQHSLSFAYNAIAMVVHDLATTNIDQYQLVNTSIIGVTTSTTAVTWSILLAKQTFGSSSMSLNVTDNVLNISCRGVVSGDVGFEFIKADQGIADMKLLTLENNAVMSVTPSSETNELKGMALLSCHQASRVVDIVAINNVLEFRSKANTVSHSLVYLMRVAKELKITGDINCTGNSVTMFASAASGRCDTMLILADVLRDAAGAFFYNNKINVETDTSGEPAQVMLVSLHYGARSISQMRFVNNEVKTSIKSTSTAAHTMYGGALLTNGGGTRIAGLSVVSTSNTASSTNYAEVAAWRFPPGCNYAKVDIKQGNDAHLLVGKLEHSGTDTSYTNEVVIGGWSNSKSVIRAAKQGANLAQHSATVLNSGDFVSFWVKLEWSGNQFTIKIGKSAQFSSGEIMSYTTTSNAVANDMKANGWDLRVSSGWGSTGQWRVHEPYCWSNVDSVHFEDNKIDATVAAKSNSVVTGVFIPTYYGPVFSLDRLVIRRTKLVANTSRTDGNTLVWSDIFSVLNSFIMTTGTTNIILEENTVTSSGHKDGSGAILFWSSQSRLQFGTVNINITKCRAKRLIGNPGPMITISPKFYLNYNVFFEGTGFFPTPASLATSKFYLYCNRFRENDEGTYSDGNARLSNLLVTKSGSLQANVSDDCDFGTVTKALTRTRTSTESLSAVMFSESNSTSLSLSDASRTASPSRPSPTKRTLTESAPSSSLSQSTDSSSKLTEPQTPTQTKKTPTHSRSFSHLETLSASLLPTPTRTASFSDPSPSRSHTVPDGSPTGTDIFTRTVTMSRSVLPTRTPSPGLTPSVEQTASAGKSASMSLPATPTPTPSLTLKATETETLHNLAEAQPFIPGSAELADSVALVTVLSGAGVVAAAQNRLSAVSKLIACGEGDFEDEPDRLSSPLKWQLGDDKHRWARGLLVGNCVVLVALALVVCVIALGYAKWKNETLAIGLMRLRMPGIMIVPVLVLLPPSAAASTTVFWWGRGFSDLLLALACVSFLVFAPCVYVCVIGYLCHKGRVLIEFQDPENPSSRDDDNEFAEKYPRFASTIFYRGFMYLAEPQFEFVDTPSWIEETKQPQQVSSSSISNNSSSSAHHRLRRGGGGGGGDDGDFFEELLVIGGNDDDDDESQPRQKRHSTSNSSNNNKIKKKRTGTDHSGKKGSGDVLSWFEENPFTARHALVFEDFSSFAIFPSVDIIVSALLGLSAGTATGIIKPWLCFVCFAVDIICTFIHLFLLLRRIRVPAVTPRFVMLYTIVASFITFVAVCLAFVMYLGRLHDTGTKGFAVIGFVQSILGIVAGIIGVVDLVVQLWDAMRVRARRTEANFVFTLDDDLLIDLEEELGNIDVEAELAALESAEADAAATVAAVDVDLSLRLLDDNQDDDDDDDVVLDPADLMADLGNDDASQHAVPTDVFEIGQEADDDIVLPDLNHLLDDDNSDDGNNADYDPYKLYDEDEHLLDEEARRGAGGVAAASRGNAEMQANIAELQGMLEGAGGAVDAQQKFASI